IDRSSEWPTEISSVSVLLDVPIPLEILNNSCSSLSQRASHLLSELSELFLHSSNMAGNGNSSPEILEMLELILSTVSMLRVIMGDELRSTTPFWSLLIRSLAHVCYDKSYIIEDVPFVCARPSPTHAVRPNGHASLLISHLAEVLELPKHDLQDILAFRNIWTYIQKARIYDLTDPSSALQFAQFILSLQTHKHSYPSAVFLPPLSLSQSRNESLPLSNAIQSPTLIIQCKINITHQKRGKTVPCATWKNNRSKWKVRGLTSALVLF
ncbi:hypothetical protein IW262DRAFT_1529096, partial [Armillaria fumosa]